MSKDEILVSIVTSNQHNDVTKNFTLEQSVLQLLKLLKEDFYQADLFTLEKDWHLLYYRSGKFKMKSKPPTLHVVDMRHDHVKKRILDPIGNIYLEQLGVTTKEGLVKKGKQDKYLQINKYIEKFSSTEQRFAVIKGKARIEFRKIDHNKKYPELLNQLEEVTFLSFTNKINENPKNVISSGVNAISQIKTIKKFQNELGLERSIFLIPNSNYKNELEKAIEKTKIKLKDKFVYDIDPTILTGQIEKLTRYKQRKENLLAEIEKLEADNSRLAKEAVIPGDSIPNKFTKPGILCCLGPEMIKSLS